MNEKRKTAEWRMRCSFLKSGGYKKALWTRPVAVGWALSLSLSLGPAVAAVALTHTLATYNTGTDTKLTFRRNF